jgi:hypothetical protein
MKTPWNSIAESVVKREEMGAKSYRDALESPCLTCQTTPCCTHLPLNTFQVTNLVELDHAIYLLNFDRIELGISASGEWSSYYSYPCRFLDRETHLCTLHNTSEQPRICQHYNPYNCWYKRTFSVAQNQDFIRIDYDRMQFLLPHIELNEERQIVSVPAWEPLQALMAEYEDKKSKFQEPDLKDEVFEEWEQLVLYPETYKNEEIQPQVYSPLKDPCTGCGAYCCKTLVFPQNQPKHVSNLDYYRFCLGFPGVELGISDGGWSIIIRTRCRHLDEQNRCSLFGKPERPLLCKYYDAWKCDYKPQFGKPRPANFLRVRLEQFLWLSETIPLSEDGAVVSVPATDSIRVYIENRWHQANQLK